MAANEVPPSAPPRENGGHRVSGADLWAWQQQAKQAAQAAGLDPREVDWLLQALTDLERLRLRLGDYQTAPAIALACPFTDLAARWQRRLQERVPVQYLAGSTWWRGLPLQVSPAVLIPRPETELLIDLALAACQVQPELAQGLWVDLGTGSGAIALGLATALPEAQIHAVDCSADALAVAAANAAALGLTARLQFHQGSWWQPLADLAGQVSGVLANPPYIPRGELARLEPEVAWHEPHLALDGGPDGLAAVRELIATSPAFLRPGGFWAVELMLGQAAPVAARLAAQGDYAAIQNHPDLTGRDRFVSARRR